jgi:NAD(P)-dependent dehydrogenase (short-subunit alcohol dehydrogenase family)
MTEDKLLEGDTALVTGAGQGIGRAIALALSREGAKVLTSDLDKNCDIPLDLCHPGAANDLAQDTIRRLGQVSIFVHAACPPRREEQTVSAVTESQWREMLEVNLNAGFLLAQAFGQHMRETGIRGRMLFVTSLHADSPRNLPHYSASKAAQTMVVKEFARALGPHGIRVNAIVPGAVPGAGFRGSPGLAKKIALRRLGTPEDIAPMAVAVLSERFGGYMTGASIVIDGGIALYNWLEAGE